MIEINKSLILLKNEINSIDVRTDSERIRYELYSIYVNLLLSREIFPKNEDIKELCSQLNFEFKDYVYKSRTLIIARFMRKIEQIDSADVTNFFKTARIMVNETVNNLPNKNLPKEKKLNFLDKFGRA
ncbi:hypothetical protein [Lactiplantibacillus plantarum]|uniref:hypothetical protein n=1 Tax=Lactiplantibacillus plantarum TaxID=1590 RepID=UPI0007C84A18|nr:hypothetical protein [Lactiplantibacillus plantarum]MCK8472537.1 hypothetical protein [Lactiplantibacillus plantarum]QIL58050.1 hypothetical protein EPJ55_10595 [Lactiplantibacillus plantarum]WLT35595.1 hypothetical protein FQU65_10760 [Lactiplantibacillus plantarum]